ncbi:hypothetical protein HAX54_042729, partial [Datura stramonium]|nr:hypothetical protein [Datura stramonium]
KRLLVVRTTYGAINCLQSYDTADAYGAIDFLGSYDAAIAYGAMMLLSLTVLQTAFGATNLNFLQSYCIAYCLKGLKSSLWGHVGFSYELLLCQDSITDPH